MYRSARKQGTGSIFSEGFLHVLPRLLWCESFHHIVFYGVMSKWRNTDFPLTDLLFACVFPFFGKGQEHSRRDHDLNNGKAFMKSVSAVLALKRERTHVPWNQSAISHNLHDKLNLLKTDKLCDLAWDLVIGAIGCKGGLESCEDWFQMWFPTCRDVIEISLHTSKVELRTKII